MKEMFEQLGFYVAHGDPEISASAARAQELSQYLLSGQMSAEEYQELMRDLLLIENLSRDSEAAQQRQAVNHLLTQLISAAPGLI